MPRTARRDPQKSPDVPTSPPGADDDLRLLAGLDRTLDGLSPAAALTSLAVMHKKLTAKVDREAALLRLRVLRREDLDIETIGFFTFDPDDLLCLASHPLLLPWILGGSPPGRRLAADLALMQLAHWGRLYEALPKRRRWCAIRAFLRSYNPGWFGRLPDSIDAKVWKVWRREGGEGAAVVRDPEFQIMAFLPILHRDLAQSPVETIARMIGAFESTRDHAGPPQAVPTPRNPWTALFPPQGRPA
jgi:hypothetical protein